MPVPLYYGTIGKTFEKEAEKMKLIIVRHADPDYEHDSLTEYGVKEATLLNERSDITKADYCYCSPLGRARKTAELALRGTGKAVTVMPWLEEFRVIGSDHLWDKMPDEWTKDENNYALHCFDSSKKAVGRHYNKVCKNLDKLLKKHGYDHKGKNFKVLNSNHDTVVLFCHFGVECVLLSHILKISPMVLWHGFVALPSSVTTLVTEERKSGIASFRLQSFGDLSHLYKNGVEPSFAARFCECFSDDTRH